MKKLTLAQKLKIREFQLGVAREESLVLQHQVEALAGEKRVRNAEDALSVLVKELMPKGCILTEDLDVMEIKE